MERAPGEGKGECARQFPLATVASVDFERYLLNQARMALALAADWLGRAAMPPWLAPGTLTKAVGTPRNCRAV